MERFPLGDHWVVPEPAAKDQLAAFGVAVPARDGAGPYALKAYGPGIVHKTDVGAVALRVAASELDAAKAAMTAALAAHGLAPAGFLVEAMDAPGLELIVGVVDRGFGPMLAVGLGGTLTEVLDDVVLRCLPVDAAEIDAMLGELRGARLLDGWRGEPAVDRAALVALVDGVARFADSLGPQLVELECNPVIARADGAVAVDARLIVRDVAVSAGAAATPPTDFTPLFEPRGIAVVGVSATKEGFGTRAIDAYKDYGWSQHIAAIHPSATEIRGVPAYPSLSDVPFALDYVLAAVPATACADLVAQAAGVAPFVHVISGGFREASTDGLTLEASLLASARDAGVRVLGPNCMGVFAPKGRQTFQQHSPTTEGHVSIISQSGGLAGDIIKGGTVRGVAFSKLVSIGNAIDVTVGELLDWLIDDPATKAIGLYLEDQRNGDALVRALRRARGAKPVVALVGGLSRQGGQAAASHTGALAGDDRVWQAISRSTGVSIVQTLEDFQAALAMIDRLAAAPQPPADNASTLVIGVGGGASVLATDACDRAGLTVTPVDAEIQATLRAMGYGAGTSVRNPLEIPFGPAAPVDSFARATAPIFAAQSYRDVLVHINVQSYYSYGSAGGAKLLPVADAVKALERPGTRVVLAARNTECAPAADAEALFNTCRDAGVLAYRTLAEAATAIACAQRFDAAQLARGSAQER